MKVKELQQSLKNDISPVYFITGDDDYLKDYALNAFVKLLNPDVVDFNLNIFQDFSQVKDITTALGGYPLMDDKKVVVVKESTKPNTEDDKALVKYFNSPEPQSIFVIFDNGDLTSYHKYGEVVDCSTLNIDDCAKQVALSIKTMDAKIEQSACKKLAEYCLCDLRKVHNEIDKLVNYASGNVITCNDVEKLVTPTTDYKIYEFTQSLAAQNVLKAKKIMDTLLLQGNKPLMLIQSILTQYKRMLYSLISKGKDEEIAKSLNVKPFAVKMARQVAENYSPKILKQYCESLVDIEYKTLTGQTNETDALKTAISLLLVK